MSTAVKFPKEFSRFDSEGGGVVAIFSEDLVARTKVERSFTVPELADHIECVKFYVGFDARGRRPWNAVLKELALRVEKAVPQ